MNYAESDVSDEGFGAIEEAPQKRPQTKRRKVVDTATSVPTVIASTIVVPAKKSQKKAAKGKKVDVTVFKFLKL